MSWRIRTSCTWGAEDSYFPKTYETMDEAAKMLDFIARSEHNTYLACDEPHNRMTCSRAEGGGLGWNGGPKAPLIPEYYLRLDGHPYMRIRLEEFDEEPETTDDRSKRRTR